MFSTKVNQRIFLIDLKPDGLNSFIASYVLKAKKMVIVETGPAVTVPNLLAGLREIEVDVEDVDFVAVSHIHLDHSGGAGALLNFMPKAKLIVHKRGAPHIARPEKLWKQSKQVLGEIAELYGEPTSLARERIIPTEDGMTFNLGEGVELKVVETLGHASHHQSFLEKKTKSIFLGDAAGIFIPEFGVIMPTTPLPCRLDIAIASLKKLINLKPAFLYYSHFGKAHSTTKLHGYLKQLRLWAEIAKQGMEQGSSQETICREIMERDANFQGIEEYIKKHPILSRTVLDQSIKGIVEYVRRNPDVPPNALG